MALQITNTGIAITTGITSAAATLPLNSAGASPKYIRISATQSAYVRIGNGAQTAVVTDMLIMPSDSLIMATLGATDAAALQVTMAGIVQISPVEDTF